MCPTIPDGALVLVHRAEKKVESEGIYAFSRDGQVFVNRLSPISLDGKGNLAALLVMGDNPVCPPETVIGVDLKEIRIVGRVRNYVVTV